MWNFNLQSPPVGFVFFGVDLPRDWNCCISLCTRSCCFIPGETEDFESWFLRQVTRYFSLGKVTQNNLPNSCLTLMNIHGVYVQLIIWKIYLYTKPDWANISFKNIISCWNKSLSKINKRIMIKKEQNRRWFCKRRRGWWWKNDNGDDDEFETYNKDGDKKYSKKTIIIKK